MFSAKRLAQVAKKWERGTAFGRKRLMWTREKEADVCCTSMAVKGHCIVYTTDGRRFVVPLTYLGSTIVGELPRMSQNEFGFTSDGRITVPCDVAVMEYIMCLLRWNASEEVTRAFMSFVVRSCHYGNALEASMGLNQQVAGPSF